MGGKLGSIFGKKRYRILMVGLDNAGKTSILTRLRLHEHQPTIPTVGFTVETVAFDRVQFTVWDVGGQEKIRPLWRHYFTGTQGLIFVVDSSDHERIDEARRELDKILNDREMRNVSLLVLCNKQDLPGSMSPDVIRRALRLDGIPRPCAIMACSAVHGTGLDAGVKWLAEHSK